MPEKVFCLVRETFQDRFIRGVARRVNFIALVARAHRLTEAIEFLEELSNALRFVAKPDRRSAKD